MSERKKAVLEAWVR